jgi:hypothetical protein
MAIAAVTVEGDVQNVMTWYPSAMPFAAASRADC